MKITIYNLTRNYLLNSLQCYDARVIDLIMEHSFWTLYGTLENTNLVAQEIANSYNARG